MTGKQPSKKRDEEAAASCQQTKSAGKMMVTRRDAVIGAVLDRHGGSVSPVGTAVSALGTIAIVVLTWTYVSYSKKQWQEMQTSNQTSRESLVGSGKSGV